MTEHNRIRPSPGTLVAIVAACAFAILSAYVGLSSPTLDAAGEAFFVRHRTPFLDQVATDVTAVGGSIVAVTITVIVATILLLDGHRALAALLPSGVVGGSLLARLLKSFFDRPRPSMVDTPVFHAGGSAYPSGHSLTGTVLMILLVYVIHRLGGRRRAVTVAAATVATALIATIGLSRVYLGVHHPTDVAGGVLAGIVWAALCIAAAHRHLPGAEHSISRPENTRK